MVACVIFARMRRLHHLSCCTRSYFDTPPVGIACGTGTCGVCGGLNCELLPNGILANACCNIGMTELITLDEKSRAGRTRTCNQQIMSLLL